MPPFFISCNLQVEHMEISENFTTPLPKAELVLSTVSKFVNSLPPSLNKSMYSCLVKVALSLLCRQWYTIFSSNSAVALWCPCRLFLKDHTGDYLMVPNQDCRVNEATLSVQNQRWPP